MNLSKCNPEKLSSLHKDWIILSWSLLPSINYIGETRDSTHENNEILAQFSHGSGRNNQPSKLLKKKWYYFTKKLFKQAKRNPLLYRICQYTSYFLSSSNLNNIGTKLMNYQYLNQVSEFGKLLWYKLWLQSTVEETLKLSLCFIIKPKQNWLCFHLHANTCQGRISI